MLTSSTETDEQSMRRKLIGQNIEPKCCYCKFGQMAPNNNNVLCIKKGIMNTDDKCRKYIYDPLKRVPVRMPDLQKFTEDDFRLD